MTDAQFNQIMDVLRSIETSSYNLHTYLTFIQDYLFSLLCVALIGLSLWIAFKVLKPYLFRV